MMLVDPKPIVKRLTRNCTRALEAAVAQCVNARHYEVTLEHVLLALLDDAESDIAFLAMHYDLNPAHLRQTLQRSLDELRSGNAGKPVFSPAMLEWMQDAWLVGSLEYGFQKIRSGMLFGRLVQQPLRYSTSGIGLQLEGISKDDLKANLQKIVAGSKEEGEALAGAGGAGLGDGNPLVMGTAIAQVPEWGGGGGTAGRAAGEWARLHGSTAAARAVRDAQDVRARDTHRDAGRH